MSTVRIPPVLRPSAGGARQVEANGDTLERVLRDLFSRYPSMREQIVTPDGDLSRFVNVFVNDQDVRYVKGLQTPVTNGDTITLLPAMAGGSSEGSHALCQPHRGHRAHAAGRAG